MTKRHVYTVDWEKLERELKWHRRHIHIMREIAQWSKDPSTKVGCVIVDDHNSIVASGYNGFARGVVDSAERYNDRETKYRFVVHADTNAMYDAARRGVKLAGCTMYLSGPPCCECMKGLVQVGIRRVCWPEDNPFEKDEATLKRWAFSIEASQAMAREAGIEFVRVPGA